ncbi:MAG: ATP-binding cassette domain-containing protein [Bacteroidetes bacterium]|jgi:phospholipid/cholesterol/gamma-HCH transport system ATP-binding protein|nr:ATP-binding cassette domain-containing protein [Bacteroidota bacterium]
MIEVRNIDKSFGSLEVLKQVSLTIQDEETLAIIGRSGSGKSVLMKHLMGLITPDRGEVIVDGVDINAVSYGELRQLRRKFGMLFQGGALFDSMSVFDNLAFPLRTFSALSEEEIKAKVEENLKEVQLEGVEDKNPAELSGGMKKRVALARAIALTPQYIIYDEPTSGLDPETSNTINDLIRSLSSRSNVTSIVVTHDMHSVLTIADRAAFIHDRDIHWVGTIEEMHLADDPTLGAFVRASEYQVGAPDRTASP